nr:hypothetical protein BAR15_160036 [Bartonella sp. AR 15-3]
MIYIGYYESFLHDVFISNIIGFATTEEDYFEYMTVEGLRLYR